MRAESGMAAWHPLLPLALLLIAGLQSREVLAADYEWSRAVDCEAGATELKLGNSTITADGECYTLTTLLSDESGEEVAHIGRWKLPQRSRINLDDVISRYFYCLQISSRPKVQFRPWLSKPPVEYCVHRNGSAPLGSCRLSQWKALGGKAALWSTERSPFEPLFLEVKWTGDPEDITVAVREVLGRHRMTFFAVGLVLMLAADPLSKIVFLYYGVGMSVGVLVIVGIIVYQLMRILPLTRGSTSRAIFLGTMLGAGGLLLSWLSGMATEITESLGLGDELVNPLVVVGALVIVLIGAAMGFWFIRKMVLTPAGELDPQTIVFVKWSLLATAAALLAVSTPDSVLGTVALVLGSTLHISVYFLPKLVWGLVRKRRASLSVRADGKAELDESDIPGTPVREASRTRSLSPSQQPQNAAPPAGGSLNARADASPILKQTFMSTVHHVRGRRAMSKQMVDAVSRECTRVALKDLVGTPQFATWMDSNLHRVVITPDFKREQRPSDEVAGTALLEEAPYSAEDAKLFED